MRLPVQTSLPQYALPHTKVRLAGQPHCPCMHASGWLWSMVPNAPVWGGRYWNQQHAVGCGGLHALPHPGPGLGGCSDAGGPSPCCRVCSRTPPTPRCLIRRRGRGCPGAAQTLFPCPLSHCITVPSARPSTCLCHSSVAVAVGGRRCATRMCWLMMCPWLKRPTPPGGRQMFAGQDKQQGYSGTWLLNSSSTRAPSG